MSSDRNLLHALSDDTPPALSRRHFLWNTAGGLGGIALAWLLSREQSRAADVTGISSARAPHFAPKAKRVVQVFCCGGVSHIDTFDYKPELERLHGKTLEGKGENLGFFFGQPGKVMKSAYDFRQHGQCGAWVSSLLPHLAGCVDDVCFIHSMFAKSNNHTPATFQMNSGFTMNGFPSMGAWLSYGLGTENENFPAFVVLPDPRGLIAGGSINWTSGFLPANHQGVPFRTNLREPIVDLNTPAKVAAGREADLNLLAKMNREYADAHPGDSAFAARLRSYELAARMQVSIPEATDLDGESDATKKLYGLDEEANKGFARNCLMARRLLERGVRFVQIFNGGAFGSPRINWDGHENLKENHDHQAATMDKPVAALIQDLKQRGMLEDTLFIWATEFGRGPATQGLNSPGRDHHPTAFTCFLAGAGVKKGFRHGVTDDVGYFVAENKVTIPDFHATILHLLGLDHEKLTFYHNGINRRLTDVHGKVIRDILT